MSSRREADREKPGCLVASILFGIAGFAFLLFVFPNCDASSKKGRRAKSLPPERLAELYTAMAKLRNALPPEKRNGYSDLSGEEIPEEFKDLDCRVVRPGGAYPLIRLEGCMDHHLDIVFFGLGEPVGSRDNSPRIALWSGEFEHIEDVLWKPEPAPLAAPKSAE